MPYTGKLLRVNDNVKNWGVLIDTDEKGETWFTIFDKKLAGQASAEHEAVCDVHLFKGERVTFEAERGGLKDKDGPEDGERWNSVITAIALEDSSPAKSVREMAAEETAKREAAIAAKELEIAREVAQTPLDSGVVQEPVQDKYGELRRLEMDAINARAKVTNEIIRLLEEA